MVQNLWTDTEAQHFIQQAGNDPADKDLALRVFTSQLLGRDKDLVMHGGGNTSVKVTRADIFGTPIDVLHIKGSGWDLQTIQAPGLPAVAIQPLMKLRQLDTLSDADMVHMHRAHLLDCTAPNPSVEALLHAYIPHKFVDHTHATPMLALANLPDVANHVRDIFGDTVALVPYIMPGFDLAKAAADIFDTHPHVEGLLLVNHGHFTFADTAKKSYDLMIAHVNAVEQWVQQNAAPPAVCVQKVYDPADILPILRGVIGEKRQRVVGGENVPLPVFDVRTSTDILAFLERDDIATLATRGVATPDHVIRTKGYPLLLTHNIIGGGRDAITRAVERFIDDYTTYFKTQVVRFADGKTMLDPTPNLAWIQGVGMVAMGANASASAIIGDIAEQTCQVIQWAEDQGGFFPICQQDLFDMEYWSLEQAKLGKTKPPVFNGKVVIVTGAGGAIGLATAQAFKQQGASVFLVDINPNALNAALSAMGGGHKGIAIDVTQPQAAHKVIHACIEAFGGADILVSNAGSATNGSMADMDDTSLRNSFELNFFAHQQLSQQFTHLLRQQGTGGQMLFNVSKQAVNPGKDFGAYGLPKATTMFLVKQLALELGGEGIRVNGINADRIRSGLLTDDFIAKRSTARGVSATDYMAGNLLKREVTAKHVADGFIALATSHRTTAHILTVDGGNIEASLR